MLAEAVKAFPGLGSDAYKATEESAAESEPKPEHLDEAPDGETPGDSIKGRNKPKRPSRKLDMSTLAREKVTHELPEAVSVKIVAA